MSSTRPVELSPGSGQSAGACGNGSNGAAAGNGQPFPISDDQPTVISQRPPVSSPLASDSASRILQGRIQPGDSLGPFHLLEFVGGGGMGRVFRATDTRLARDVALKILPPEQANDEETLRRFQNEAQSAARLDHENIARVYFAGEDRGLNFIVFEFIEGVNIRALVEEKGPLALPEAVSYVLQVAEALSHAAGRDVVHRDIKPSNILIAPDGRVKLIDMGLARLRRVDPAAGDLTASGTTLGTFDYISPEQARDPRNADVRSDIYSLGCTFFFMLAGRPPFPEGTVLQKLLQHQGDQPPDIRQFRPDVPDEVARVLRKMLAKDPRHRYHDPAELVEELTLLAYQVGLRTVGAGGRLLAPPQQAAATFLQRHLPWMAPVAALVLIVAALHLYSTLPSGLEGPAPVAREASVPRPPEPPGNTAPRGEPGKSKGGPLEPSPTQPPPSPSDQSANEGKAGKGPPPKGQAGVPAVDNPPPPATEALPAYTTRGREGSSPWRRSADEARGGGIAFDPLQSGIQTAASGSQSLTAAPSGGETTAGMTAAAGVFAQSPAAPSTAEPDPKRAGVLIVNGNANGRDQFSTLAAACAAAANGDVIELRFNGPREEQPIALANLRVTIRAGADYRPVIVFRPTQVDPVGYPRNMFTLTSGRLKLVGVAVEFHVPRDLPSDRWSLVETRGGQSIRLEQCVLSIRNASDRLGTYNEDVACFRTKTTPGTDTVIAENNGTALPSATIELSDSVVRGEAVFLRAEDLQPVRLLWENGLLATSESLLSIDGGPAVPHTGEVVQIELRHCTGIVQAGLCQIGDTLSAMHQMPTEIHCTDSILVGAPDAALINQVTSASINDEEFGRLLEWNGARNFYEGFDAFWTIRDLDDEDLTDPWDFETWATQWGPEREHLPKWNQVVWKKLPEATRPLHTHTPEDYALGDSTPARPNPAIGSAGAGRNAGFDAERLPKFRSESAAATD